VKLITGQVLKISPFSSETQPKSKLCKITIGETEVLVGESALKKLKSEDELEALIVENENPLEPIVCISFHNLTRNVSVPSRKVVNVNFALGIFAILFGIFIQTLPVTTAAGLIAISSGAIIASCSFKLRKTLKSFDEEIARLKSQDQENS
jgi:hypothetical protein